MPHLYGYLTLQDFRRARHKADVARIASFLQSRSMPIFAHDEVYQRLQAQRRAQRERAFIPIDAITGSISHYEDFRRAFLPKNERSVEQWTTLALLLHADRAFPPIDVYQIGESYFIHDGNHRIMVARQLGATMVEVLIARIKTPSGVSWASEPEEIILQAEAEEFFARTHLPRLLIPDYFTVTVPGKFHVLLDQIDVCGAVMSQAQQRDVPREEAAQYWHDQIYVPTVNVIDSVEILRDFPERSATDLYIWIAEHREILRTSANSPEWIADVWTAPGISAPDANDAQQLKIEHDDFLRRTQLGILRPDADIRLSKPGQYRVLDEHIAGHRYFMGLEQRRDIAYIEAVTHWHDAVYLPIVRVIETQHLLDDFPACTVTELYLWISTHQLRSHDASALPDGLYLQEIWTTLENFPYEYVDELLIKIEAIDFLLKTHLYELRPNADLTVSIPGQYRIFDKHIEVHRYFMGIEQRREIPSSEAVTHWHDTVYLPVVKRLKERRLMREFPALTAADMYLWVSEHRVALERRAGSTLPLESVLDDLLMRFGAQKSSPLSRPNKQLLEAVLAVSHDPLASHSSRQRAEIAERRRDHLVATMLVRMPVKDKSWFAVDAALIIAQREEAHLLAAHVLSSAHQRGSDGLFTLKSQFEQRCQAAQVHGELRMMVGDMTQKIADCAQRVELVVLTETSAAAARDMLRVMQRSSVAPLLFVLPAQAVSFRKLLLWYDGTPKSNEALFVSAYCGVRWECELIVVTSTRKPLLHGFVSNYVARRGLLATLLHEDKPLNEALPELMRTYQAEFVVIGADSAPPLFDLFASQYDDNLPYPLLCCL